jgi:hypothetical protein
MVLNMDRLIRTEPLILETVDIKLLKDLGFKKSTYPWADDVYCIEVPNCFRFDRYLAIYMSKKPQLFGFGTGYASHAGPKDMEMPRFVSDVHFRDANGNDGNEVGVQFIKDTVEKMISSGAITFNERILQAFEVA